MENKELIVEWIDLHEKLPPEGSRVLVKTDCADCPQHIGYFVDGEFWMPAIMQCDKHYETDQKFTFIKATDWEEMREFTSRISYWLFIVE